MIQKGKNHWHWMGGKQKTGNGYIQIYDPSHPMSDSRGRVYEHRVVMEKKIGRYLKEGEVVHHINKNRRDNRPDNLELFISNGEHLRKEFKGNKNHWAIGNKNRLGKRHSKETKDKISISLHIYHNS